MNKTLFRRERLRMKSLAVTIPVSGDESVSGVLEVPQGFEAGRTAAVIVAHGAGNDMHNPFWFISAQASASPGTSAALNFPYKEKARRRRTRSRS